MTEVKREFITWHKFHEDTKIIIGKVGKLNRKWKGILAVTRGGLIPAGIFASELNIRLIETISITSYQGLSQGGMEVIKGVNPQLGDGDGWLVVDDLVDSGDTARKIRELLPKAFITTVYAKPKGLPMTDIYAKELEQELWVDFPWELLE